LGRVRNEALALGYARVYVVPSSRLMREMSLLPSDEFIQKKLKEHDPAAALGVTCGWYLRNRLLAKYEVGDAGYHPDKASQRKTVFQGVLLAARNCRQAKVDWEKVRCLLRQHNHRPLATPAVAGAGDSAKIGT
jgi:hypothetical protein